MARMYRTNDVLGVTPYTLDPENAGRLLEPSLDLIERGANPPPTS